MVPSTPTAIRIAKLFNRRPTTAWTEKEVKAYKQVVKSNLPTMTADLDLIERYYAAERRKDDKGIHRRDLQTFLNNYPSELDRAHAWKLRKMQHNFSRTFRETSGKNGEKPATDEEFAKAGVLARAEMERFRNQLRNHV